MSDYTDDSKLIDDPEFNDVDTDGKIDDVVETYLHHVDYLGVCRDKDGNVYFTVSFDNGPFNGQVRVPMKSIKNFINSDPEQFIKPLMADAPEPEEGK